MSVLLIGVNYRTDDHAIGFAKSLAQYPSSDISVVLVDNSEKSDFTFFLDRIAEVNPEVRCIAAPKNLGYFGGANYGLNFYLENRSIPDWIIVCNVDIEFCDPNFFEHLHELKNVPNLGVIAPCIWSIRWQKDLNPKMVQRPAKKKMQFYKLIFDHYYVQNFYELLSFFKSGIRAWKARIFTSSTSEQPKPQADAPIYAPHGSCMIFHRRYLESGANLAYSVFLFGEEIFVAEACKDAGLMVMHCPVLSVLDKEHASTGIIRSRRVAGYMKDATNYLLENYFAQAE